MSVLGLYGVIMVLAWVSAAFRFRDYLRDRENRPLRALLHVAVSFGAILTLIVLAPLVDEIHEIEGLTSTVWHVIALWAAAQFGVFLLTSTYSPEQAAPRVRRRMVAFGVAAAVMVVAWLAASPRDRAHGMRVVDTSLWAVAWQGVFLMSLAWSLADGARLAFQYARQASGQRDLRTGLHLLGAGAVAGLMFCLSKLWTASVQIVGVGPIVPGGVLVVLVATSMGAILAGMVYPGVAGRVRAIPLWLERRRLHRELWPLWSHLRELFPRQVMGRPPRRGVVDALTLRHLPLRQYRRVVETRDMLRELRPWFSPAVRDQARQGTDDEAIVHGVVIAAALRARAAGELAGDDETVLTPGTATSLMDESRWLAAVSRAWQAARNDTAQPEPDRA